MFHRATGSPPPILISSSRFDSFIKYVEHETSQRIEVMAICLVSSYEKGQRVNRVIVPDQAETQIMAATVQF